MDDGKISEGEVNEYGMEEEKPFSSPRWTEIPRFKVLGNISFTEEEKRKNSEEFKKLLKKYGINIDEKEDI